MSVLWEYQTGHNHFTAFDQKTIDEIEPLWAQRHINTAAKLKIGKNNYIIDFSQMTQTNDYNSTVRTLRRKGADGSVDTREAAWDWHDNKHKLWKPYYKECADQLESHFKSGKESTRLSNVFVSAHDQKTFDVDFNKMEQVNADGKKRKIRRTESVVHHAPPTAASAGGKAGTAAAATRRGRSPEKNTNNNNASPSNSATTTFPTIKDWKLIGPDQTVMWLNAEKSKGATTEKSLTNLNSIKVAAFDLDDCLIMPASGKIFPTDEKDWKWLCPQVVPKLKELSEKKKDAYIIVALGNQTSVTSKNGHVDPAKRMEIEAKLIAMNQQSQGVRISAMFATHKDTFKLPSPKLWWTLQDQLRAEGILAPTGTINTIENKASFFVGDEAGRKIHTLAGRSSDHSCSDRKFARNVGADLDFFTPEEFFLGQKPAAFDWHGVSPSDIKKLEEDSQTGQYPADLVLKNDDKKSPDLVLVVGRFAGCGKSSLAVNAFNNKDYHLVSHDTVSKPDQFKTKVRTLLKAGHSVVVDCNGNSEKASRNEFIDIAKSLGVDSIRCVVMGTSEALAGHLMNYREVCGGGSGAHHSKHSSGKFEEPTTTEGFTKIVKDCPVIIKASSMSEEQKSIMFSLS